MLGQQTPSPDSDRPVLKGKTRRGHKGSTLVAVTPLDAPVSSDSEEVLPDEESSAELSADPPGFTCVSRTTASGRNYKLWFAPDGSRHSSRVRAWVAYHATRSEPPDALGDAGVGFGAGSVAGASAVAGAEPSRPAHLGLSAQCGDPHCLVPSVNGRHTGLCRFPPPTGKRHRQ